MPEPVDETATRPASADELARVRLVGAAVEVVSGPDAGACIPIGPAGITIGTSAACDLRLRDDLVSRRHVRLLAQANGVKIVDLGSLNGTTHAGARIREIELVADGVLGVGRSSIAVRLQGAPLDCEVSLGSRFGEAIGHSLAMRHVFALLGKAATTAVTVLLEGDSGTGKDVLARSIHQQSARKDGPFVVVDCGAIPENLVESELFGHERGAFTGAVSAQEGAFESAHGGTLFLDEVGELPLETQPKLLRVLEARSFRRLGSQRTTEVDVRIVAATNRRLRESVRRGEFREDLFYRLSVVHVSVPRLADRPEDIVPLAETFLRRTLRDDTATLPPELGRLLSAYAWPGNARELRNVIERYATFGQADPRLLFGEASPAAQPSAAISLAALDGLSYHEAKRRLVDEFHRLLLPRAVERADGSIALAAEALGLPKASLYRMLKGVRTDSEPDGED